MSIECKHSSRTFILLEVTTFCTVKKFTKSTRISTLLLYQQTTMGRRRRKANSTPTTPSASRAPSKKSKLTSTLPSTTAATLDNFGFHPVSTAPPGQVRNWSLSLKTTLSSTARSNHSQPESTTLRSDTPPPSTPPQSSSRVTFDQVTETAIANDTVAPPGSDDSPTRPSSPPHFEPTSSASSPSVRSDIRDAVSFSPYCPPDNFNPHDAFSTPQSTIEFVEETPSPTPTKTHQVARRLSYVADSDDEKDSSPDNHRITFGTFDEGELERLQGEDLHGHQPTHNGSTSHNSKNLNVASLPQQFPRSPSPPTPTTTNKSGNIRKS